MDYKNMRFDRMTFHIYPGKHNTSIPNIISWAKDSNGKLIFGSKDWGYIIRLNGILNFNNFLDFCSDNSIFCATEEVYLILLIIFIAIIANFVIICGIIIHFQFSSIQCCPKIKSSEKVHLLNKEEI